MIQFNKEFLQTLLDAADCHLPTLYDTPESTDLVLWDNGQAFHLTLQNDMVDSMIVLTSISYSHCLNLF